MTPRSLDELKRKYVIVKAMRIHDLALGACTEEEELRIPDRTSQASSMRTRALGRQRLPARLWA